MRKFNFNTLKAEASEKPEEPKQAPKKSYGAYRTIISRHEAAGRRLEGEPTAQISEGDN